MLPRSNQFTAAPYTETLTMSETIVTYRSFVGVDLHKCTVTLVAVDPGGDEIAKLKTSTKCTKKITGWLRDLPDPVQMAVEACGFVEWTNHFGSLSRKTLQAGVADKALATKAFASISSGNNKITLRLYRFSYRK